MIDVRTLTDGGQEPVVIARELATFLDGATKTLDLALYDLRLVGACEELIGGALRAAPARGVEVRLLYNSDHANPIPVPPPPEAVPDLIEALPFPTRAVSGIPDLMHHKYAVRDGESVWTGSTNWTDDSWSRQENVIVRVTSPELARAFTLNFDELWEKPIVEESGRIEPRPVEVAGVEVRPWFTPGHGDTLSHRIAKYLGKAKQRIRIASPVITSGPVLATLAEIAGEHRCDLAGVVDDTQCDQVFLQWRTNGVSGWKVPLLQRILEEAPFSGKGSIPWSPESTHNFMHAKLVVADDVVFVGSFNLSRSGERNAENVLEIHDAALADRLAAYVDEVRSKYPPASVPAA